ncbi:uncharacterized protein KY384_005231 [Bacidia gigantensis]|uniref:uncharacterized protein n=1 Tax=Bacidia gigantensis TaxID=2732470 RepID=UPI001D04F0D5|nr:uncharacterized protein KY384_005231 [Bacidia gigantensis]KAG8529750.1 hypothetical protein KY384_005231 [Bacidia gigantensis]
MAPKGGGGHGGGGRSSSGGSSFSSGSSSPWLRKTETLGSGFHDGLSVALIVFAIIFFIVLVGIKFWAASKKKTFKNVEVGKRVMNTIAWSPAVWFGIIYYAFEFTSGIIEENQTVVATVYYLIRFIILSLGFLAEIFLLVAVYALLNQLFLHPNGPSDAKASLKRKVFIIHMLVCAILTALYIAFFAYGIKIVIDAVNHSSGRYLSYGVNSDDSNTQNNIDLAYEAIYFVCSVEIFVASIFLLITASKRGFPQKVAAFFVGLVAFPLFVRTIFILAFTVVLTETSSGISSPAIGAESFIVGLMNMLTYAGIVVVCSQLVELAQKPWGAAPPNSQPAPMVQNGTMPPQQYAAAQPYPQQPVYGAPQQYPANSTSPQQYGAPQQYSSPPSTVYTPPPGQQPAPQHYSPPPQQVYQPPPQQLQGQPLYGAPQEVKPHNTMAQAYEMPHARS